MPDVEEEFGAFETKRAVEPSRIPDLSLVRNWMETEEGLTVFFNTGHDRRRWMEQAGLVR